MLERLGEVGIFHHRHDLAFRSLHISAASVSALTSLSLRSNPPLKLALVASVGGWPPVLTKARDGFVQMSA